MKMTTMKFRQLIDMAIGTPEPGHVNFSALHCLLTCIGEKLGITDEVIEYSNNENEAVCCNKGSHCNCDLGNDFRKLRLFGGTNAPEEKSNIEPNETPSQPESTALPESPNADVTKVQDLADPTLIVHHKPSEAIEDTMPKIPQKEVEEQVPEQEPAEVLSPTTSKDSTKSHSKSVSSRLLVHRLNERVAKIELEVLQISLPKELESRAAKMKSQLDFVIEQLLLLTFLTLSKKPDSQQIRILHSMAQALCEIKKDNINIHGYKRFQFPTISSLNWQSLDLQLNEDLSENDILEDGSSGSTHGTNNAQTELQCRTDKKFCEMLRQINDNHKKFSVTVEDLNNTLGSAAIEGILNAFKENVVNDVQALQELLKKYIESANDDCAAAGTRIKVLQDVACLSCDTNCAMKMEKAKVPKMPSAHPSNTLSPFVTYELGSIRKFGIMGYDNKEDFPNATNAWLARHGLSDMKCFQRRAGQHTIITPKEHIEKMMPIRK